MRIFFAIFCLTFILLFVFGLLAYGHFYMPPRWQARVPWTNMRDVEVRVGKPSLVVSNDDIICWDYSHWWSGTMKVYFYTNGDFHHYFTEQ